MKPENIRKYTKDLCIAIQRSNTEEQRLTKLLEIEKDENSKIMLQLKACRILQEKQKKHLELLIDASGNSLSIEEIMKEVEKDKLKKPTRAEEKATLDKINSPDALKARKIIGISILEARTIYNRLNTQALHDLIECYKEYNNESQINDLELILSICCCSEKKGKELIKFLAEISQKENIVSDIAIKNLNEIEEMFEKDSKEKLTPELVKTIYLYLPYLNTNLTDKTDAGKSLRNLLGLSIEELSIISALTNAKNILDLLDIYRHNKELHKWGLFSPEQVDELHNEYNILVEHTLRLIHIISTMSQESQFVPPAFFAFVTGSLTNQTTELNLSKFGENQTHFLTTAAISGIFAFISQYCIPIQKLILEYFFGIFYQN